jgi:hypothetical protein
MDSLGDYIYLIIIAIAGISSILGKRKKKALEESESLPGLPDFEDFLPDPTVYTEPVRPVYQELKKREKPLEIPSYDTVKDFSVMKANKQVERPRKHFVGSEVVESEDMSFNILELDTPDEVRKAFIYSEIFNRKY